MARDDTGITGFVEVVASTDTPHAVLCFVAVRPDRRRRGIGTTSLRAALPLMVGKSVIETWFVVEGGDGEHWAAALDAMNDAPFGDAETAEATYSVEQVRADEENVLGQGGDIWVVLAMRGTEIAGLTTMHRNAYKPTWGEQRETVVLPAHRGHGLGRVMKAHLLRNVSGIDHVQTRTNSENEHMLRVDHSLGHVDMWTTLAVNAKIADLRL